MQILVNFEMEVPVLVKALRMQYSESGLAVSWKCLLIYWPVRSGIQMELYGGTFEIRGNSKFGVF